MGCCNEPATALAPAAPDPSQHVNYAKGMVLGVDDFTQEFAWLSGRDRWLAREAAGFGTLSGLRVFAENDGAEGPRLHVSAGTALTPGGQLVCVPADQCAVLNRWLAKAANAAVVYRLLNPESPPLSPPSPPPPTPAVASGVVSLYLTLCWSDCATRPVPIPGEPCRADDELMAPSRVADDFRLELRERAPDQTEEDALRDFVRWLRGSIQVVDASPPPPADEGAWLEALRRAAGPWLDAAAASPPPSPPAAFETLGDYLFELSPPGVAVARDRVCDFVRAAMRFWVTELRPLWTAYRCHRPANPDGDCVLLARVELEVAWAGGSPTGAWQVAGSPVTVTIDETTRPFLGHLRLLQEWVLCCCADGGAGAAPARESLLEAGLLEVFVPPPAPASARFIVGSEDAALPAAQSLGAVGDGLLRNTVAGNTGTLSVAAAGTDYYAPGSADVAVADGGTGLSTPPADGQLLIGGGGAYVLGAITDTPRRVKVEVGPGSIRLTGPQDLDSTAIPTFAGLATTGGRQLAVELATASLALAPKHHVVVATVTGIIVTLPAAVARTKGRAYVVKNASPGTITLDAPGADLVDGLSSIPVKRSDCKTVVSDGAGQWHVITSVL